ncbi:hypothetical protein BKK81_26485 [Cupriavidus sp. USMAHM13]|uniref:EAL domain-containing response regulator n=1 Tax=Cupriavidus sp. USMAHM13 TaxID=1389192 RepID=UPI0008A6DFEA|nr:EAL domain-containing response regulator [Cupriavidus sp. USMAHM13]AOZ02736.1 hypothetical protein BKK81_26485 [Cupriavidus sp. USMAHM13]
MSPSSPMPEPLSTLPPWQVLLVDDEPAVHDVTRLVLRDLSFGGRPVVFHSAYRGEQCLAHLSAHPDTALVLLDVVMETDQAGLEVVHRIRRELRNADVQIVLRTGHPGMAPEAEVVLDYEINGYFVKTELTARKLASVVIAGLRSYQYVRALQQAHLPPPAAAPTHDPRTEEDVARALRERRYRLQAQCQVDLARGTVAAVALLPEWPQADGWLPHAALANRLRGTALLEPMHAALLRDACALAGAWRAAPLRPRAAGEAAAAAAEPPPRISVPVLLPAAGAGAILQALPEQVRQALDEAGLPAGALDLLLSGHLPDGSGAWDMPGGDAETARLACSRLRDQGVTITLGDVGSGPISLAHLRRLQPDRMQIARSHVDGVAADPEHSAIARAVIALAHTLGVQSLADGIASAADLEFFKWEGCDQGQGDLLGPPCPVAEWLHALPAG